MARPPRNETAAKEFGERLTDLQAERGITPKDIELWLWSEHKARVSIESIRKAHAGMVDPANCDFELLAGLRAFYDVGVDGLGSGAERRLRLNMVLAGGVDTSDLANRSAPWTRDVAGFWARGIDRLAPAA